MLVNHIRHVEPAIIIKTVNDRNDSGYIIAIGIAGAAFTMAYQVAGKAVRDTPLSVALPGPLSSGDGNGGGSCGHPAGHR